mgnify:CR=1 FL=1
MARGSQRDAVHSQEAAAQTLPPETFLISFSIHGPPLLPLPSIHVPLYACVPLLRFWCSLLF